MSRHPAVALRTRSGQAWLVGALVLLVVGVPAIGLTSLYLSQHRETTTCTVSAAPGFSRLRDGMPSWRIPTSCGGTLYIDSDASGLSTPQAAALERSLSIGGEYSMVIQGVLHNPLGISAYLVAATPVAQQVEGGSSP